MIALTSREVGKMLLDGDPRIMTHAEGDGHQLLIRPVAMKPGEHKLVARRLYEIFSAALKTRRFKPEFAKPPGRPVRRLGCRDRLRGRQVRS